MCRLECDPPPPNPYPFLSDMVTFSAAALSSALRGSAISRESRQSSAKRRRDPPHEETPPTSRAGDPAVEADARELCSIPLCRRPSSYVRSTRIPLRLRPRGGLLPVRTTPRSTYLSQVLRQVLRQVLQRESIDESAPQHRLGIRPRIGPPFEMRRVVGRRVEAGILSAREGASWRTAGQN